MIPFARIYEERCEWHWTHDTSCSESAAYQYVWVFRPEKRRFHVSTNETDLDSSDDITDFLRCLFWLWWWTHERWWLSVLLVQTRCRLVLCFVTVRSDCVSLSKVFVGLSCSQTQNNSIYVLHGCISDHHDRRFCLCLWLILHICIALMDFFFDSSTIKTLKNIDGS